MSGNGRELGGSFALGPWRVHPAGYGAMQLAGDGVFGPNACAYHVADVIQALRAWARERGVADGQLTILAIEPAAGGRQPTGPGLPGFAFSTIPLPSAHRRETGPSVGSAAPAEPEP